MPSTWASHQGRNGRVAIPEPLPPKDMVDITPLTGLAICQALRDYTGLDLKIKWPNDIYTIHRIVELLNNDIDDPQGSQRHPAHRS